MVMRSVAAMLPPLGMILSATLAQANERDSTSKFISADAARTMHLRNIDLDNSTLLKAFHRSFLSASKSSMPGSRSPFPLLRSSSGISPWLLSGRSPHTHRYPEPLHAKPDAKQQDPNERVQRDGAEPGPLKGWPLVYKTLVDSGVKALTREEVLHKVRTKGAVLVDVRQENAFQEETMEGAINLPFFRPKSGSSFNDNLQKLTAFVLGVKPTERNPNFLNLVKELPRDKDIIIACDRGGTLTGDRRNSFGTVKVYSDTDQYTLSLKAAYEVYQLGFRKIYFLTGGFNNWVANNFPTVTGLGGEV